MKSAADTIDEIRAAINEWTSLPSKRPPEPSDRALISRIDRLLRELPKPQPDPVAECLRAYVATIGTLEDGMRNALLRYRELGCPDLEDV